MPDETDETDDIKVQNDVDDKQGPPPPGWAKSKEWMVIGLDFIYDRLFHNNLIIPFFMTWFFSGGVFLLCECLKHDVVIGIST